MKHKRIGLSALLALLLTFATVPLAGAITQLPLPDPAPGSYGLEATKTQPPPTTTATVGLPSDGATYTTSPITVAGLCTNDLLVQVYDNDVLVGAIDCTSSSYSIQVSLFTGDNDINAIQYDDLMQPSPDSNHVTVTYNNADFAAFGTLVTLTSNYGRRAADPGQTLTWPLQLSGGTGPYALSVDWGDGKPAQLQSQTTAGAFDTAHVYVQSGVYHVTVKASDKDGSSAFIQLVAVANGTPTGAGVSAASGGGKTAVVTHVLWIPAAIGVVLILPAYWLGRRSELVSLHHKLEHDVETYKEKI